MRTRLMVRALVIRSEGPRGGHSALVNYGKHGPRLLGGRVKKHETMQEALRRELVEEIGCGAIIGDIVNVTESLKQSTRTLTVVFKAQLIGEPVAREKKIKLQWVPRGLVCGFNNVVRFQAT